MEKARKREELAELYMLGNGEANETFDYKSEKKISSLKNICQGSPEK